MYTDLQVAINLYSNKNPMWFMLTCIFIVTPFLLVWVASLRHVQKYVSNLEKTDKSKSFLANTFLALYIFPPVGSIIMFFVEIVWVFSDILDGFLAFVRGTGVIESNNAQYLALKAYRRAIEIFGERYVLA